MAHNDKTWIYDTFNNITVIMIMSTSFWPNSWSFTCFDIGEMGGYAVLVIPPHPLVPFVFTKKKSIFAALSRPKSWKQQTRQAATVIQTFLYAEVYTLTNQLNHTTKMLYAKRIASPNDTLASHASCNSYNVSSSIDRQDGATVHYLCISQAKLPCLCGEAMPFAYTVLAVGLRET